MTKPKGSRGPERESRPVSTTERLQMITLTSDYKIADIIHSWLAQCLANRLHLPISLAVDVAAITFREARSLTFAVGGGQ